MNVGSLFSGIGGFDLGFERAGMRTEWFVECDPYCQAVLRKHWPTVPCYQDVRSVTATAVRPVDLLCGGFPCQDISAAGKGAGLDGARSGLYAEFARLIGELRPRYVVMENVPMLRSRGLGRILGEMATLGYDAEWDCIPASAVGAPHRRDRIWIVAYANGDSERRQPVDAEAPRTQATDGRSVAASSPHMADAERTGLEGLGPKPGQQEVAQPGDGGSPMADADGVTEQQPDHTPSTNARQDSREGASRGSERDGSRGGASPWAVEPNVGRVAHGVPARMDRLRALGNALVPQIAEEIGRRIMSYEGLA